MKISLLMITHNAPKYVVESIMGICKTQGASYELIVVDNRSRVFTRLLLKILKACGCIDTLFLNSRNDLYARGNNIASQLASDDSTHFCLLNSDVKIKDPDWLQILCSLYPEQGGIASFGAVISEPVRSDGYCMLIGKELYNRYRLDENFEWWWSVTKLESQILADGYRIIAVKDHERVLHHYGGASGKGYKNAKGMDVDMDEVKRWFSYKRSSVSIIDKI